ncbi:zinc ribbon domain-containing protein [Pseudonocardia sp. ICBG1034]|uniref:zinc ribbon domain-containing protein n=1 Tax=Pseudonocardia sp. ICBG1034 TaxID=2844381 RepID=UPI001CCD0052|nr:zinc ribbon domain-containing protein [Pseudonocardia sp. ICBG1034]
MATVACPYCYHRIDQSRLAYLCRGRSAPGVRKRCEKKVDEDRARLTNISVPMLPVFTVEARPLLGSPAQADCPTCQGSTGIRACPTCHTPLPSTFVDSRSPMIGIVGGKGAGKTVYTAVLHHQLRTTVRRRFDAGIRLVGDQQGGVGSSRQWLELNEETLFDDGKLFETTASAEAGMRAPVVIEWRQPRRRLGRTTLDTTMLSFYDAAGEDQTSQDAVHTQTYLGVADGLVLLLDPWQLPGARSRISVPEENKRDAAPPHEVLGMITEMLRTTHRVKSRKKIPTPLAVVFAKMDEFFPVLGADHPLLSAPPERPGYHEPAGQDTHEQVRALLYEYGADEIDDLLELNYSSFRYFAVSALGAPPDYEAKAVDQGGVRPFRVEEPLLWLLSRFNVIDRVTE